MREFALSFGLRRLLSFSAIVAVSLGMLFLTGCGHHHCNCNGGCNTCHSCSTCATCGGVSDASTSTCPTCNGGASVTSTTYDRVGAAPASLSEPSVQQTQPNAYSYSGTNTSVDRELPVFSAPAPAPAPVATPVATQPQQPAGALLPEPVHGGGQYHTLAPGETIYALSRKYGVKPKAILEANHFNDPNHLSVGTKVFIPAN